MTNSVTIPVSMGGTNVPYNDGTGAYGMRADNGYGYVTYLIPMLSEVIAACALVVSSGSDAVDAVVTVQALLDSFDDRYLGAKAADPTLDNDGNALLDGALYFKNTATKGMRVYDLATTTWIVAGALPTPTSEAIGRSLTAADHGLVLTCTAATPQTFTIPSGLFAGFNCAIVQSGAGQVTVAAGGGVTLRNVSSQFKSSAQYATLGVINTATNVYNLTGSTTA